MTVCSVFNVAYKAQIHTSRKYAMSRVGVNQKCFSLLLKVLLTTVHGACYYEQQDH